jgi:hypothetical protein
MRSLQDQGGSGQKRGLKGRRCRGAPSVLRRKAGSSQADGWMKSMAGQSWAPGQSGSPGCKRPWNATVSASLLAGEPDASWASSSRGRALSDEPTREAVQPPRRGTQVDPGALRAHSVVDLRFGGNRPSIELVSRKRSVVDGGGIKDPLR